MYRARLKYLLLAVMVATSHVALVSHVLAHFQPAVDECELCVSQAQPQAAVPAAEAVIDLLSVPVVALPPALPLPHIAFFDSSHCQRAPPPASS